MASPVVEWTINRIKELDGPIAELSDQKVKWLMFFTKEVFGVKHCKLLFDFRKDNNYAIIMVPMVQDGVIMDEISYAKAYDKIGSKVGELRDYVGMPTFELTFSREIPKEEV